MHLTLTFRSLKAKVKSVAGEAPRAHCVAAGSPRGGPPNTPLALAHCFCCGSALIGGAVSSLGGRFQADSFALSSELLLFLLLMA